jgi:hypothetical protein
MVIRKMWRTQMSGEKRLIISLSTTPTIRCPFVKCQNVRCADEVILMKHLIKNDFATDYKTWVFHGEKYTAVTTEESVNDWTGAVMMDEILKAIYSEFDLNTEDPPTLEIEELFRLLKASGELLHGFKQTLIL